MIKKISKAQYQNVWKKWNGSPLQSWQWGELKEKSGWKAERIGIYQHNNLISVVTILSKPLPLKKVTSNFFSSLAYIPRGLTVKSFRDLSPSLNVLTQHLKTTEYSFTIIDPENDCTNKNWNEKFRKALEDNKWKRESTTIQPNQTDVININKNDKELMKSIRPKWRRNIRKAKRDRVEITEATTKLDVDKFYKVISEVQKNTDFVAHKKDYFYNMWKLLKPEDLIHIFLAKHKNETIGTYLVLTNENEAFEVYGGSTMKGRDLEASYLLKWEIFRKMRDMGKKYYDQWGVAPKEDKDHPLAGVSYFKSGFGGEYVQFLPQYIKVKNFIPYLLYSFFRRLKKA